MPSCSECHIKLHHQLQSPGLWPRDRDPTSGSFQEPGCIFFSYKYIFQHRDYLFLFQAKDFGYNWIKHQSETQILKFYIARSEKDKTKILFSILGPHPDSALQVGEVI